MPALQSVSMALTGTDAAHHLHFARAAEQYRRDLLRIILRHEWRLLRAEKPAWFFLFCFSAASLYALMNGWLHKQRHQRASAEFIQIEVLRVRELQDRALRMEDVLASGRRVETMPKYLRYEFEYGPLDPRYAAAFGQ